jgi:hypothetical protein
MATSGTVIAVVIAAAVWMLAAPADHSNSE